MRVPPLHRGGVLSPPAPGSRPARRWLRRAAILLAALLALLVLLLGGALLYLQTPSGGEFARRRALSAVEGALPGKVEAGELDLRGRELVLRDLKLYDPEGRLVAEIAEVRLRLSLAALLRGRIEVREAAILRPQLYLVSDDRGLNLTRAVSSRRAQLERTEPEERRPSRLSFQLQRLTITGGSVDHVLEGDERDLEVGLDDLSGEGQAAWSGPEESLRVVLELRGRQHAPVSGELTLSARFSMKGGALEGGVDLRAPGLELEASGDWPARREARVAVKRARLEPATAAAFLERYPLQVPAQLSGTAQLRGDVVTASLDGSAGRTQVSVRGSLDVERLWSDGLTLEAREVDLSELYPGGPRSSLRLDLAAKGGGRTLEALTGEVKLTVPPSGVRGETLGPIRLSASADRGRFHLDTLSATLPGASLEASGAGTLEQVSLEGKVRAGDLSELSRALGRISRGQPPALAGQGNLDFQVVGPPRRPGISASGEFARLRYREDSVTGLELTADVADVTRPLGAEATLQAAEVRVGGRAFRRVLAQVGSQAMDVRADVQIGELGAYVLGTRDEDARGLLVRELELRYPEATWTLRRPARVAFRDGFSAEPLELISGTQLLTAGGKVARGSLDVSLEAQRLDLKRLPAAFVDPELNLAGLLSAEVRARGPTRRPEVEAEVELDGGRVRQYDALGLTLQGSYLDDRAEGQLRFTSRLGRLSARFDTPVLGLLRRRREPVEIRVELDEQPIGPALAAAGRKENVTGTAGASLTVVGTADDPAARLSIRVRDLRAPDHPPLARYQPDLDVTVEGGQGERLRARVDVEAAGTAGRVEVRTPFALPELLARPPDRESLRAAAYAVDASFQDLPLQLLEAVQVPDVRGRVSLQAELRGTLRDPTLNARLEGRGVARGAAPPTDVSVGLVAGDRDVGASVRARRGSQSIADVTARAGAPLRAILAGQGLEQVSLLVDGTVGPLSLAEWLPPEPDAAEERTWRTPSGQVAARLRGRGTLSDPRLELISSVEQLRVGDACIGRGVVSYRYQDAVSTVAASLTSSGQGRATVDGTMKLDLSLPALRRGLAVGRAPLEAALQAEGFELSVLNGTLPRVRSISGKLSANARVRGTLRTLAQQGWVEWKDGALALDGYGDYRAVQLRADATGDTFKLSRLQAQSGAGTLKVTATAVRRGDQFRLTGEAEAEKFPVVYEDQLYAAVSTRLKLQGNLSSRRWDFQEISIPEASVELPDVRRKDLQDIDRPDDIVLVRHGKPVERKRRAQPPAAGTAEAKGASGTGGAADQGAPPPPAGEDPSRRYVFAIRAPRNVWIRSSDVNVEIGLSERFRVEYEDRARIFGDVRILRGQASVLGRDLEIQRDSRVTFTGPPRRPLVNVTAVHVNEREQVTVFMTVRGEGSDLTITPSSQPPLTDSEIYTLLATGRRTLKRGSGAALSGGAAASILGSLAATQLRSTISEALPLDVVSIEAGGGEGLTGTRVEVGTYLSDKAYLGGEVRIGADPSRGENTYGIRFEYQLTPSISLQTEYGDARSGSADLIWSRDY